MVIGGDTCFEGRGFESRHCILYGHFSHLFVVQLYYLLQKTKINEKRLGRAHFLKKNPQSCTFKGQINQEPWFST